MSRTETLQGVGRLHCGHRSLGCVGYRLDALDDAHQIVRLDPMPAATSGDVFHLTLADGRVLDCEVAESYAQYCFVIDGPRPERRLRRRPTPVSRALFQ